MSKTPVKVMHVVSSLNTGGLERVVINLTKRSDRMKFQSMICCLEEKGNLSVEAEILGVKVVAMRRETSDLRLQTWDSRHPVSCLLSQVSSLKSQVSSLLLLIPRLMSLMRKERVQIVHTHNPFPLIYGGLAARIVGVPIVIHTKHGRNDPEIRKNLLRNRLLSFLTDEIAAVSKDAQDVALHIEKVPNRKVKLIINGIEVEEYQSSSGKSRMARMDEFHESSSIQHPESSTQYPAQNGRAEMKTALGIPQDALVIGNVARLSLAKDHLTLLRAFTLVSKGIDNVFLVIVGDGWLRVELEEKSKELGIFEPTLFLGFRSDVPRLLRSFDLFVLSSLTEGTSLTILEAMAAGLPVIATDVGGNPGIVKSGVTGILVPPKRPEILANAIIDLLRDKAKRVRMGIAGYNRVYEHFNVENMVKSYQEIYDCWVTRKQVGDRRQ